MKTPAPICIESLEARIAPAGLANIDVSTLDGLAGFKLGGAGTDNDAGHPASIAADVNGNGLSDLLVAQAATNTYIFSDTDGDRVKIIASQGILDPQDLTLSASGLGFHLDLLNLTDSAFAGANITIKVTPQMVNGVLVGNGRVNIGEIDATGVNLGIVTIPGDLTEFHAGDGTGIGVATLSVVSLGKNAALFPTLTPSLDVAGRLNQLLVTHNVTGFTIGIGTADTHGVGLVQIGGNLMDSTLGVGAKIGQLTVTGSIVDSTVRAPGLLLPATTTAAMAIGTVAVTGSLTGSSILAGYDAAGNAVNGDAGIGTVIIKGNFAASNLVAGVADTTLDGFGRNDSVIPGGNDAILATIARLVIKGTATGSAAPGDFFGITAAYFGAAKIHGAILELTNQPTSFFPLDPVNKDLRLTVA